MPAQRLDHRVCVDEGNERKCHSPAGGEARPCAFARAAVAHSCAVVVDIPAPCSDSAHLHLAPVTRPDDDRDAGDWHSCEAHAHNPLQYTPSAASSRAAASSFVLGR
jgi:hypothetical protein